MIPPPSVLAYVKHLLDIICHVHEITTGGGEGEGKERRKEGMRENGKEIRRLQGGKEGRRDGRKEVREKGRKERKNDVPVRKK